MKTCRTHGSNVAPGGAEPEAGPDLIAAFEADVALCLGSLGRLANHSGDRLDAIGREHVRKSLSRIDNLLTAAMFNALAGGED